MSPSLKSGSVFILLTLVYIFCLMCCKKWHCTPIGGGSIKGGQHGGREKLPAGASAYPRSVRRQATAALEAAPAYSSIHIHAWCGKILELGHQHSRFHCTRQFSVRLVRSYSFLYPTPFAYLVSPTLLRQCASVFLCEFAADVVSVYAMLLTSFSTICFTSFTGPLRCKYIKQTGVCVWVNNALQA